MAKASAQTRVTVQPEGTCQIQCTRKQIVRIVLGLIAAGVLVTLVVVFAAPDRSQQHVSELKENSSVEDKLYEHQTMLAKPIETEMPQPPPIGAKPSKSPVTPTRTTTSATTRNSPVEDKLYELQTMLATPIETEMPQPPPLGAEPGKSSATPTTTTTSATTRTSPVEDKLHELQTILAKPIRTKMPQPPRTGAELSKSPVTPTTTTTKTSPDTRLTSCAAINASNPSAPSGVYTIYTEGRVPGRKVWCDMVTDGGGWTRFQFRHNGAIEFNKIWTEYRRGFGSADGECWLGNDDLHRLTATQPSELRVDLLDWDGNHGYAKYSTFGVGNASTNYRLHVSGYKGTIGDSLTIEHNSKQFTTKDRDNDEKRGRNCANSAGGGGGWWYVHRPCDISNLNGRYSSGGVRDEHGLQWAFWYGHPVDYSYKATAMMVRPRN